MFKSLPPATRAILVANLLLFAAYYIFGEGLTSRLSLWPVWTPLFEPWQAITHAFVHESFLHLFFNMFGLYMLAPPLERQWGTRNFLVYYFASVLAAAATELLWIQYTGDFVRAIGASGGLFGILLAFGLLFPRVKLVLLFPPIPLPAWLFVTLYGIFELVLGLTNSQSGVGHFAHLGGMAGGALVIAFWGTAKPARRRPEAP